MSDQTPPFAPFKVTIGQAHLDFLRDHRIYVSAEKAWTPGWLRLGTVVPFNAPVFVEPYAAFRQQPEFFSMGAFSYSRSRFESSQRIGRYCAIADGVTLLGLNHPMERLSMVGFDYSDRALFVDAARDARKHFPLSPVIGRKLAPVEIEHDVWVGTGAVFARGITIGTGAVVAGHAVVTKDVPPYAIVAGNPARVKRFRFADGLVERLLQSEWWTYSFVDFAGLPTTEPERFLDAFEPLKASGSIRPFTPAKIALHEQLGAL